LDSHGTFINAKNAILAENPNLEHSITFGIDASGNMTASSLLTGSNHQGTVNIN
jgi:hypothetical protein